MLRALVKDLEKRFGQHPWLQAKLTRLRELADRDPEMMSKEARFSTSLRLPRDVVHADEVTQGRREPQDELAISVAEAQPSVAPGERPPVRVHITFEEFEQQLPSLLQGGGLMISLQRDPEEQLRERQGAELVQEAIER